MTIKSAYSLAIEQKIKETHPDSLALPSLNVIKEKIWKIRSVPKIRIFLWKALSEALPVADLIIKRGMKVDARCQLCGNEGEDVHHVLFDCDPARQAWALSGIPHPEFGFREGSLFSNVNFLLNLRKEAIGELQDLRFWPWLLCFIWKSRNDFLFNEKRWEREEIHMKARKRI